MDLFYTNSIGESSSCKHTLWRGWLDLLWQWGSWTMINGSINEHDMWPNEGLTNSGIWYGPHSMFHSRLTYDISERNRPWEVRITMGSETVASVHPYSKRWQWEQTKDRGKKLWIIKITQTHSEKPFHFSRYSTRPFTTRRFSTFSTTYSSSSSSSSPGTSSAFFSFFSTEVILLSAWTGAAVSGEWAGQWSIPPRAEALRLQLDMVNASRCCDPSLKWLKGCPLPRNKDLWVTSSKNRTGHHHNDGRLWQMGQKTLLDPWIHHGQLKWKGFFFFFFKKIMMYKTFCKSGAITRGFCSLAHIR